MNHLPLFFNLNNQPVLIVGGGKVALRKICLFREAGARLTVIAPEIHEAIRAIPGLCLIHRRFSEDDMHEPFVLAVLATDNPEVQKLGTELCRKHRILFNRCDDPSDSQFITGSVLDLPPIAAGITSSGSPGLSRIVKHRFEKALEPALLELGKLLHELRPAVRAAFSTQQERETFFRKWTSEAMVDRIRREGVEPMRREMMSCLSC